MSSTQPTTSFGRAWFQALVDGPATGTPSPIGSLLSGTCSLPGGQTAAVLSIVPDPDSQFPRARHGEVGLAEGLGLASTVRSLPEHLPLVMLIDVPSQAYGYREELFGLHQALAASVEALAERRLSGAPIVSVVVGAAISGAFLATGLQSQRIIALDHPGIQVQVMGKAAAARITRRTIDELDEAAKVVPAIAYDGASFQKLGAVSALLRPSDAHNPGADDVAALKDAIVLAIDDIRSRHDVTLATRLDSDGAREQRALSLAVREAVDAEWSADESH